jgi:nitrite reductase (NADH) large subunit
MGLDTWVVERGVGLMARQLDPEGSRLLQSQVERLGLRVLTHTDTERIEAIGPDRLVQFIDGRCLRVQLVVAAAGIRPRDELAAACGLELAPQGGIVVNEFLRTADPNVFAIGECASVKGIVYGLAAPAYRMADALAANLVGTKKRFSGSDLSTCLKLPDLCVFVLGDYQKDAAELVHRNPDSCRRLVLDGSRLVGAVAVGDWSDQARLQELIERRGRVWSWQRSRFLRTGCLWRSRVARPVSEWPASALICNCMGVRRAVLTVACANGCGTVEQLAQATGASTVCGSCRPLLAQLVGASAVRIALPGVNWLLRASIAAFLITLVLWLMTPIPLSETVQQRVRLETLWFGNLAKQITGFILLGLALLSLLLSLRKRFKRFTLGEVGHWRAIHAGLGVLTLMAMVAHTGFRMGENLNFVLMANWLVLTFVGACAGAVNALEARLESPATRRLRALWTWGHVGLAWPLPMLVLAHVLVSYLF